MKRNIKVRFHLGAGKNFMKWRIEDMRTGEVLFFNPNEVSFNLVNCKLYNQKSAAKQIHSGANKTVCSWIMCEDAIVLSEEQPFRGADRVSYNPRVTPNWDLNGENVDGKEFYNLVTLGNKVYTVKQ